jgi:hypothetical protein
MLRGMRDVLDGKTTPHGEAFKVFFCRGMWGLIRIEKVLGVINENIVTAMKGS